MHSNFHNFYPTNYSIIFLPWMQQLASAMCTNFHNQFSYFYLNLIFFLHFFLPSSRFLLSDIPTIFSSTSCSFFACCLRKPPTTPKWNEKNSFTAMINSFLCEFNYFLFVLMANFFLFRRFALFQLLSNLDIEPRPCYCKKNSFFAIDSLYVFSRHNIILQHKQKLKLSL